MTGYSNEKMKEYMKEYVKNSETINCDCGGKYKKYSKHNHDKTKRHINYINDLDKLNSNLNSNIKQQIIHLNQKLDILLNELNNN
jgi:hypothetical protein